MSPPLTNKFALQTTILNIVKKAEFVKRKIASPENLQDREIDLRNQLTTREHNA
jgi:hypothetical protein